MLAAARAEEAGRADRGPRPAPGPSPLPCRLLPVSLVAGVLVLGDVIAFGLSAGLVQGVRAALWGPMAHSQTLWSAGLWWLGLRGYERLYPGYGLAGPEELRRVTWTTLVAGLGHAAVLVAVQDSEASRFLAAGTWGVLLLVNWTGRAVVKAVLIRLDVFNCPVVIGGAGPAGALAVHELKRHRDMGFKPVAAFDDAAWTQDRDLQGVPVLGPLRAAVTYPFPFPVNRAILAVPGASGDTLVRMARLYANRFPHLSVVPDLFGLANLWVTPRALGTCLTLEIRNNLLDAGSRRAKRALDLVCGVPLAAATLPVVALAGALVKVVSPGPVLFRQVREGQDGRPIRVLKLRTMVPDAEARLAAHLACDSAARAEWERRMKLQHDPRVVPGVGPILRRFSADELPQFWNVLRGEMSLVGPRPFPAYHLERFSAEFRELRRQVPAGVTGLWQITARSDGDLAVQEAADAYYIRNWSLWLDLWILLSTARVVLQGKGAY